MLDVVGDVSEEAFNFWGFGCLKNGQQGGPMEGLDLPMAPRTLWRSSGLWANASLSMVFDGIGNVQVQYKGMHRWWKVESEARKRRLGNGK